MLQDDPGRIVGTNEGTREGAVGPPPQAGELQAEAFEVASDLPIEWSHNGDRAVAKLDGGKAGEVVLNGGAVNRNLAAPVVIKNLKYWGAPRHDGFVLMPNEVEAYRLGPNAFEYKGTNGFMITFDISSKDVAAPSGGKSGM